MAKQNSYQWRNILLPYYETFIIIYNNYLLVGEKKDKNPAVKYKAVVTTAILGYSTMIRQVLS